MEYLLSTLLYLQMVLAANTDTLQTVAIRPHTMFGPKDQQCIPTIVKAAREGKLKVIIG